MTGTQSVRFHRHRGRLQRTDPRNERHVCRSGRFQANDDRRPERDAVDPLRRSGYPLLGVALSGSPRACSTTWRAPQTPTRAEPGSPHLRCALPQRGRRSGRRRHDHSHVLRRGSKEVYTIADALHDTDIIASVKVRWTARRGPEGPGREGGVVVGSAEYYGRR